MKKIIGTLVLGIMIINSAQAKWASSKEAPIKTASSQEITINNDGTNQAQVETQIEILKEPGRQLVANYTLRYNGDSEKITILEAKTIFQGKEYPLDKNLIEDKPLASNPSGFDQIRQILLAFPKAEIGAKIYLKYLYQQKEVPLEKFYSALFGFGHREYEEKSQIKLISKLPLHILVNDPKQVLKINKSRKDNLHELKITLTKPLYQAIINEPQFSIANSQDLTWVSISTLNHWNDLSKRLNSYYAKILNQKLPQELLKIALTAAKQKTEIAQINSVTSQLNDKIQYMGDWRSVKGRFVPRDLAKISQTQLGDCKDFAATTAVILNHLGYDAKIALVRRGVRNIYPNSLPDFAAFNHALVKVISKTGQTYWIDPTNFQSMAGGIFPDIANKMALIVDEKKPSYEKIPNIDCKHASSTFNRKIAITKDNKIIEQGEATLRNEEAYELTGAELKTTSETIKDILFNYLSHSRLENKNKKNLKLPNLKSRIVQDLSFHYSFEQENRTIKTNLGDGIKLSYDLLNGFFDLTQDQVGDILIDAPFKFSRQTLIKNIEIKNVEALNSKIQTPWLTIERQCTLHNNNLKIDDLIVLTKNFITNNEQKQPEFIALVKNLEKNFKEVVVVFNKRS